MKATVTILCDLPSITVIFVHVLDIKISNIFYILPAVQSFGLLDMLFYISVQVEYNSFVVDRSKS